MDLYNHLRRKEEWNVHMSISFHIGGGGGEVGRLLYMEVVAQRIYSKAQRHTTKAGKFGGLRLKNMSLKWFLWPYKRVTLFPPHRHHPLKFSEFKFGVHFLRPPLGQSSTILSPCKCLISFTLVHQTCKLELELNPWGPRNPFGAFRIRFFLVFYT